MTPDIATFAKAIASGYPFGAVVGRRDVMDCGVPASGTFNGNPVGWPPPWPPWRNSPSPGSMPGWKPWASGWRTASRPWGRSTAANSTSATWGSIFVLGFGYTQDLGTSGLAHPGRPGRLPALRGRVRGLRRPLHRPPGGGSISPPPTPRRTSAAPWQWPTKFWERWNRREFNMIDAMQWFQLNGKKAMVTGGPPACATPWRRGSTWPGPRWCWWTGPPAVGEAVCPAGGPRGPGPRGPGDLSHWGGHPRPL